MFQRRYCRLLCPLIFALILLAAACNLSGQVSFDVQSDENDFINYTFGGGEVGADLTQISIRGDGHVTYHYLLPYMGTWPQEEITREHQLSAAETGSLFQTLVDAGLFDLKNQETQGQDVPRTSILATIDDHELDVAFDGTPGAAIHNQITNLVQKIYPASNCQKLELADRFSLVELGVSRAEATLCLGEPAEVQEYDLPTGPFSGPSEGLSAILKPGTPVEEWIYHDDDDSYYLWFASPIGETKERWQLIEKATYPKGAVF